jgi:hypothetical protein
MIVRKCRRISDTGGLRRPTQPARSVSLVLTPHSSPRIMFGDAYWHCVRRLHCKIGVKACSSWHLAPQRLGHGVSYHDQTLAHLEMGTQQRILCKPLIPLLGQEISSSTASQSFLVFFDHAFADCSLGFVMSSNSTWRAGGRGHESGSA